MDDTQRCEEENVKILHEMAKRKVGNPRHLKKTLMSQGGKQGKVRINILSRRQLREENRWFLSQKMDRRREKNEWNRDELKRSTSSVCLS